jgi:hypothetical protein
MQDKGEGDPIRAYVLSLGAHAINSIAGSFRLSIVAPVERRACSSREYQMPEGRLFVIELCAPCQARQLDFDNENAKRMIRFKSAPFQMPELSEKS